eukprot:8517540-Karenia_brevis.AAC.1
MTAEMPADSADGTTGGHNLHEQMPDGAAFGAAHVTPDPKRSRSNETVTGASSGPAFPLHPPMPASYGPAPHHRHQATSPGNMMTAIQDMLDSQTDRLTKHMDGQFTVLSLSLIHI